MKQIIITILTALLSTLSFCQVKKIIYFNSKWQKTTKEKATYYRNLPLEEKEGKVLVRNYYMSGAKQMVGWAYKDDNFFLDGEVKWFYENGNLHKIGYYRLNNAGTYGLHGTYKEYHENGNIYKEENYFIDKKNGKANYYDEQGKLITSCTYEYGEPYEGKTNCLSTYKEGKLIERKLFYENTEKLAYEEYHDLIDKHNNKEIYYSKSGEILKEKRKKGHHLKIKFYPSKKCGYVVGIKHIKNFKMHASHTMGEELFYNRDGEILYKGIGHRFNGTFYETDNRLSEETEDELYYFITYKEGEIINYKSVLKGSVFTNGDYLNEEPYNGTFLFVGYLNNRQSSIVFTLKNGLKEGKESYYDRISDISIDKTAAHFNYKNGKKEGKSSIYYNLEDENHKMFYKNDEPYEGFVKDENYNILQYKNGTIIKEKKRSSYRDYNYFEVYENKIKTEIEYNFLDNDRKEIEPGILKNGKPFNGYFFNTKLKAIILDYYKNGIKKPNLSKKLNDVEFFEIIDNE